MAKVLAAARERGEALVAEHPSGAPTGADTLVSILAEHGYEPTRDADGAIRLRNCPFHALVERHRALTCSMNLAMLEAVTDGVARTGLQPEARPEEGFCCVALVPEPAGPRQSGRSTARSSR
jgi:predicted ArsR family transcriptional regulator